MLKRITMAIMLAAAGCLAAAPASAEKPAIYTSFASDVAVGGYDPVAYFRSGEPLKGEAEFEFAYKGAKWRFASAANLAAFKAAPETYAPQFGGYCAWAVSQGYTAKGDPRYWKIVGGKLYLNYNADIQAKWEKDIPGLIGRANANWPGVLK